MGNISYYWNNKQQRAQEAVAHTEEMATRFAPQIQNCVKETRIHSSIDTFISTPVARINFLLKDMDSVSAIFSSNANKRTAVLNFASYKNPGGGFIAGSRAQEECLCHESFLYNVLKEFPQYYHNNQINLNYGLYTNRALYSPKVIFERNGQQRECDVITCAAPNATTFFKYHADQSNDLNDYMLTNRIYFVLNIAASYHIQQLILGAFGCGVFGQDPTRVATLFKDLIIKDFPYFSDVIFAVPHDAGHPENYLAFEKII